MSGRSCVARCITIVPSAWNAEAIAIRSRPERSSAQVRISRGCACSNRSLSATSSSAWRRVCNVAALVRGWRVIVAPGVYLGPVSYAEEPLPLTKGRQPQHVRHRPDPSARRHPRQPARHRRGGRRPPRRGGQSPQARGLRPRACRPGDARRRRALTPHGVPGRGRLPLDPRLDAPQGRPPVVDTPSRCRWTRTARTGWAAPTRWRSPPVREESRSRSFASRRSTVATRRRKPSRSTGPRTPSTRASPP